ncbi:putative SnoaL-like polyketide cyclase [Vibrio nigripulchritudo SO65]|uniref:nuclear transport factor 2 family protein n=1 Tax=Vibrio nigripulchritudo TaxID=28173 RepID=UPI0003B2142C|nr:nuclear transport factor 2 family protein [Vibrio nigripulchritudo]CCN37651.1 putative SnoaL-like polyketide cyclase [Vibrio nigripulchritudo AM115]CCN40788.1 putative SnoaL-like polyketide cyclase [Vibrio nigripulchritudo FTn2]CCN64403.1 putative SnoaL-like polyketide cyclase [Vibrio nigripulchritudo POn4]CCN77488.1 putative SnoaL-like polyketide cyclase [Vibrio nigripulchritudo SO65]
MEPRKVVEQWVKAFNQGDANKIADFYHTNAVNHQVANEPVEGKAAIKAMFEAEFSAAEMVCIVENIFQDGEWAVLEWKDPIGLRGCGFFKIEGGLITFQRGYWDKLSFLRAHNLPIPTE